MPHGGLEHAYMALQGVQSGFAPIQGAQQAQQQGAARRSKFFPHGVFKVILPV
jgi:hypothetical protein